MLDRNRIQALQFIEQIEAQYPNASAYFIANELRRYTRRSYNDIRFAIATFSESEFINNSLDISVKLSRQEIDLAHFIAALSDNIRLPGLASMVNFTTAWTAKHSSWAGDLGQAIWDYQEGKFTTLEDALVADASLPDLAANIASFVVGQTLNEKPCRDRSDSSPCNLTVSQAIRQFDAIRYPEHIRTFIRDELGGNIHIDTLTNPQTVEANIRRGIAAFLSFIHLHKLGKQLKNLDKSAEKLLTESEFCAEKYQIASLYFLNYLVNQGELNSITFQPYKNPFLRVGLPGFEEGEPVTV